MAKLLGNGHGFLKNLLQDIGCCNDPSAKGFQLLVGPNRKFRAVSSEKFRSKDP